MHLVTPKNCMPVWQKKKKILKSLISTLLGDFVSLQTKDKVS